MLTNIDFFEYRPAGFVPKMPPDTAEKRVKATLSGIALGASIGYNLLDQPKGPGCISDSMPIASKGRISKENTVFALAVYYGTRTILREGVSCLADCAAIYRFEMYRTLKRYGFPAGRLTHPRLGTDVRAVVIGAMVEDIDTVIRLAYASSLVYNQNPEGYKGAIVAAVVQWIFFYMSDPEDISAIRGYILTQYPECIRLGDGSRFGIRRKVRASINGSTTLDDLICLGLVSETQNTSYRAIILEAAINAMEAPGFDKALRNGLKYPSISTVVLAMTGAFASARFYPQASVKVGAPDYGKKRYVSVYTALEMLSDTSGLFGEIEYLGTEPETDEEDTARP